MHKGIGTLLYPEVGDLAGAAVPECLRAIGHLDSFERQTVYLAEGFRRIDETVEEPQIAAIPHRCAIGGREIAGTAGDVLAFPDDIHAFKTALDGLDMPRLLKAGLSLAYTYALQAQVAGFVERSFSIKIFVF